jgi:predicted O-linked N-acetylglucosamine transferase (SPINDLY family)
MTTRPRAGEAAGTLLRDARRALEAGNPHQALALARRLAKLAPREPAVLNAGAWIAHQAGDPRAAARLLEQSLAADGDQIETLSNLASLHQADGRFDDAVALLDRALARAPAEPRAAASLHYNRGNALKALGRLDAAEHAFRAALALQPDMPACHGNLANTLVARGRLDDAVASYRQSLALRPRHAETMRHLTATLRRLRRFDEAAAALDELAALEPEQAETHAARGALLRDRGDFAGALAAFREAVTRDPLHAEARHDLGVLLLRDSALTDAIGCFETAIALHPSFVAAHVNLGNALTQQGRIAEAMTALERAAALAPDEPNTGSALLFAAQYLPDLPAAELTRRHVAWAERAMDALALGTTHGNRRDPARRLRVGYVSADFRRHAVGDFLMPLLAHHDRVAVEIVGYAEVAHPDRRTAAFEALADRWRPIVGLGHDEVAAQIRADAIDILVDLSGHTAHHRLAVFARKPAPIQLSWLGYPCTTGMAAIDFRLTDALADPAPAADAQHRERLIRLPDGFQVYVPPLPTPEVGPLPADATGAVTFGSFNNLAKVNDRVIAAWARLLDAVPGSRLLLKFHQLADAPTAARYRARFTALGIAAERVLLEPGITGWADHMARYGAVDIGLDPFPYNGTTTTCEALWMGVPVVTVRGDRHAARVGTSLLTRLGLAELIADDLDGYIATAAALAADRPRLAALRAGLRARITASPLGDPARFARAVEAAYREIWSAWCARQS